MKVGERKGGEGGEAVLEKVRKGEMSAVQLGKRKPVLALN